MYIGQLRTYVLLVHRCRRFFPAGADQQIWDECWPALPQVFVPQSFEVRPLQSPFLAGLTGWPCTPRFACDRAGCLALLSQEAMGLACILIWGSRVQSRFGAAVRPCAANSLEWAAHATLGMPEAHDVHTCCRKE